MILDEKVIVKLGATNIQYYKNLGYELPIGLDKKGRKRVVKEQGLLVNVSDLPVTSEFFISVMCEDCKYVRKIQYGTLVNRVNSSYNKTGETLCSNCANARMSGSNNSNYKHGNSLYPMYRNNARRRGLEFSLTIQEFESLIPSLCFYCNDESGGIDRWDSSIGYIYSNCVPCCKECNFLKNNTNPEKFILRIKNMYNTLKLKGLL